MSQAPQPEAQAQAPTQVQPVEQAPTEPSQPSTEDLANLFTLIVSLKRLQREAKNIKEEYKVCFVEGPHSLKCPSTMLYHIVSDKLKELREVRDSFVAEFVELASTSRITSKQFLELIDRAYSANLSPMAGWGIENYFEAFNTAFDKLLSDETLNLFINTILMALKPGASSMEPP